MYKLLNWEQLGPEEILKSNINGHVLAHLPPVLALSDIYQQFITFAGADVTYGLKSALQQHNPEASPTKNTLKALEIAEQLRAHLERTSWKE